MAHEVESGREGMPGEHEDGQEIADGSGELGAFPIPGDRPIFPLRPRASGLYRWGGLDRPIPIEQRPRPIPLPRRREELRLDIDGTFPQMVASGSASGSLSQRADWIARLTATGPDTYGGSIFFKDPAAPVGFPYTHVAIVVTRSLTAAERRATVTFSGGSAARVRTFDFVSPYFHPVDFELDSATGEAPTASFNTASHPNRPATLPAENLTIQRVFQRAGFEVTTSPAGTVPIQGAGPDVQWSNQELHDAMQAFWSRFSPAAQWAMWVFFASLSDEGTSLGGIMFDDIGPNHRQGTAIFNDSFIATPPAGDAAPAAWVRRMIFWTAVHEMGHAFNLAHSWQKSLGTPWVPLTNEPEARSFMNYPFRVTGGQTAFFADFGFRFSDPELLFMRHAPARFVQHGNAAWFDHHGFEGAAVLAESPFRLEVHAPRGRLEFLEPVSVELLLKNVSAEPQLVDERLLSSDRLVVVVKRDGQPAYRLLPFVQRCWQSRRRVLEPGESLMEELFVSAGRRGWMIAEPGWYTVQVALGLENEDLVSDPLQLRVDPPRNHEEELLAQDVFSDDVGRVLGIGGSRFFGKANDTLREVTERLEGRRPALHAELGLGGVLMGEFKELVEDPSASPRGVAVHTSPAEPDEGRAHLEAALTKEPATAVGSFGALGYKRAVDRLSDWLADQGDKESAKRSQDQLRDTLAGAEGAANGVWASLLEQAETRRSSY
jgi:hypothetical protein